MRIVHIIPAAFHYFDDIRDAALAEVEAEQQLGLDVEALVLQYGSVTERFSANVARVAPTRVFQGMVSDANLVEALNSFDIIHVHCPMLGLMKKLIIFKKTHPAIPLVVTNHRPVPFLDLFTFYILCYTSWYTPRLLRIADTVVSSATPRTFDYYTLYKQLVS